LIRLASQIPNAISVARGLCAFPLAWLIAKERWRDALVLAFAAGMSDLLDGFLAKRFGWQSQWGKAIDPLADKLLLLATFVALTLIGAMPMWLMVIVFVRDFCIVSGALVFHLRYASLEAMPSMLGKLTTFCQIGLALTLIAERAIPAEWGVALQALMYLCATLTVASWLDYGLTWHARSKAIRENKI
jgi:cardiolipin synthase (CMP-forming)